MSDTPGAAPVGGSGPLFDANRPIGVRIPGGKTVEVVRFPTDVEWADRQRQLKVLVKQLGRGKSKMPNPDSSDVDLALLGKIRDPSDSAPVDGYEAIMVIEQLGKAEVDDIQRAAAGTYRVTLRVPGMVTYHVLRMPTAKEIFQHERGVMDVTWLPYSCKEIIVSMEVGGELYAKLRESVEGYAAAVPLNHQAVVVQAIITAVREELEPERVPDPQKGPPAPPAPPPGPNSPPSAS